MEMHLLSENVLWVNQKKMVISCESFNSPSPSQLGPA